MVYGRANSEYKEASYQARKGLMPSLTTFKAVLNKDLGQKSHSSGVIYSSSSSQRKKPNYP